MTGIRYLFVSGLCMATHVLVMVLADRAGVALPFATLLSFAVVVAVGYALHARITFPAERSAATFASYALAMAFTLPLSATLLWVFARALGWPMPFAAPAGALATTAINFVLVRWSIAPRPLLGIRP